MWKRDLKSFLKRLQIICKKTGACVISKTVQLMSTFVFDRLNIVMFHGKPLIKLCRVTRPLHVCWKIYSGGSSLTDPPAVISKIVNLMSISITVQLKLMLGCFSIKGHHISWNILLCNCHGTEKIHYQRKCFMKVSRRTCFVKVSRRKCFVPPVY